MTDSMSQNSQNEECIKLFCHTVNELNTISLKQMEGLLSLAVKAVEAADSNGSAGDAGQFVDELKAAAEELDRRARAQEERLSESIKNASSGPSSDIFCAVVEQRIGVALENSLAFQQQLNELGAAILAKATTLVFSSAGNAGSSSGETI